MLGSFPSRGRFGANERDLNGSASRDELPATFPAQIHLAGSRSHRVSKTTSAAENHDSLRRSCRGLGEKKSGGPLVTEAGGLRPASSRRSVELARGSRITPL